MCRTVHVANS